MSGSPQLDEPVRSRDKAALDVGYKALREIEQKAHERETVLYARKAIARMDQILNA